MLASVQKITSIKPIEGADNIQVATVLGWQVVIKKDEYKVGDLVSYIQIDTVVPEKEQFEFLRPRNFRVRTIKLRGQISQGLIVPLPEGKWEEGDDVTTVLGIKKYEKPDNNPSVLYEKPRVPKTFFARLKHYFLYSFVYRFFPSVRPKLRSPFPTNLVSITDENRIQNIPKVLETHKGKEFVVSYKLDGSSITIIHEKRLKGSNYRICSRRFELHDKNNDWYKVFTETEFSKHIDLLVKETGTNDIIVQGEAIGKFNGNHHGLEKDEIRLFNIYVNGKRLNQKQFYELCAKLQIPCCPMFNITTLNHTMDEILELSNLKDSLNPKVPAEGLVWRCIEDNLSFKVINNNYLLKEK